MSYVCSSDGSGGREREQMRATRQRILPPLTHALTVTLSQREGEEELHVMCVFRDSLY
jgi:hypothetical protein